MICLGNYNDERTMHARLSIYHEVLPVTPYNVRITHMQPVCVCVCVPTFQPELESKREYADAILFA